MVLCQFFQDLSSKVDILIDIWGPGHGVDNLTDNNQLALTSRGPHQMNIFIISLQYTFYIKCCVSMEVNEKVYGLNVDKVKPKASFKSSLYIDQELHSVGLFHHVLVYM